MIVSIIVGVVVLPAAAIGVREWRRNRTVAVALAEGRTAYESGDWDAAARLLGRYVSRNIDRCDDRNVADVCRKFAEAQLSIQPLEPRNVGAAVATYRRLLRDGTFDGDICARLAFIFQATSDAIELDYIAHLLQKHDANDPRVELWLAQSALWKQAPGVARQHLESLVSRLRDDPTQDDLYIQSCLMLSALSRSERKPETDRWIEAAVERRKGAAEPLIARARSSYEEAQSRSGEPASALIESAKADAILADSDTDAPAVTQIRLCELLQQLGLLDRAEAVLLRLKSFPQDRLRENYLDLADWTLDVAVQEIDIAVRRNQIPAALDRVETGLMELKQPQHRTALLPTAVELAAAAGKLDLAAERLNEYQRIAPQSDSLVLGRKAYLRALLCMAGKKPYSVIELLEPLRDLDDFNEKMRGLLAQAYRLTGQGRRVAFLYRGVAPTDARALSSALAAIEALLLEGDLDVTAAGIQHLANRYPDNTKLELLKIDAELLAIGKRADAAADAVRHRCESRLRQMRDENPDNASLRTKLADLMMSAGRFDEAEQELIRAATECIQTPEAMLQLANFYVGRGRNEDARRIFGKARSRFSVQADPWLFEADFLLRANQRADARELLVQAISTVTADSRPAIVRQLATSELRDDASRDQGIARLCALAADNPDDVETRFTLMRVRSFRDDRAAAERTIEEIRTVEGPSGLRWRLFQAQLALDDLESGAPIDRTAVVTQAEELLNACIKSDPTWTPPVLLLGELLELTGRREHAEALYRRSLTEATASAVVDRLELLLEQDRRFPEALELMHQYPSAFSQSEYAARLISLSVATGDRSMVEQHLNRPSAEQTTDPQLMMLSAMLTYSRDHDAVGAESRILAAEKAGADPLAAAATRAGILREDGRYDDAVATLNDIVTKSGSFDAHLLRGAFLESSGHAETAAADFKQLPALATDARGHAQLALFYARSGQWTDSIAAWEAGLRLNPDDPSLIRGLAKSLVKRHSSGDLERAIRMISEISPDRLDTELEWIRIMAVDLLDGPEATARVCRLLDAAALAPRASAETFRALIKLAIRVGANESAEKLLNAAMAQCGEKHPVLLTTRARWMISRGHAPTALGYLREALAQTPDDPEIYELVTFIAPELNDIAVLRPFETRLEQLLSAAPANERLQLARAGLLKLLDDRREAIEKLTAYWEAGKSSHAGVSTLLALSELHRDERDFDKAADDLNRAELLAPDSLDIKRAWVALLSTQRKTDEIRSLALDFIEKQGLADNPHLNLALFAAQSLVDEKNPDRADSAITLYQRIIEKAPNLVAPRLALGLISYRLGRMDMAMQSYRDVLRIDPNQDEALNNLAWILSREGGNPTEGLELARRAVAAKETDPQYRDTLAAILDAMPGRAAEAREQYARSAELWPERSIEKARALLKLARTCQRENRVEEAVHALETCKQIDSVRRVASSAGALTDSERREIEQNLRTLKSRSR